MCFMATPPPAGAGSDARDKLGSWANCCNSRTWRPASSLTDQGWPQLLDLGKYTMCFPTANLNENKRRQKKTLHTYVCNCARLFVQLCSLCNCAVFFFQKKKLPETAHALKKAARKLRCILPFRWPEWMKGSASNACLADYWRALNQIWWPLPGSTKSNNINKKKFPAGTLASGCPGTFSLSCFSDGFPAPELEQGG